MFVGFDSQNTFHSLRFSPQPRLELQGEHVGVFGLDAEAHDGVFAIQRAEVGAGFPLDVAVEAVADEGFAVFKGVAGDGGAVGVVQADADLAALGGFEIQRQPLGEAAEGDGLGD